MSAPTRHPREKTDTISPCNNQHVSHTISTASPGTHMLPHQYGAVSHTISTASLGTHMLPHQYGAVSHTISTASLGTHMLPHQYGAVSHTISTASLGTHMLPHQYGAVSHTISTASPGTHAISTAAISCGVHIGEVEGHSKATHLLHSIDNPIYTCLIQASSVPTLSLASQV